MTSRRSFLHNGSFAAAGSLLQWRRVRTISDKLFNGVPHRITQLEKEQGGRIGVCIADMATNKFVGYRVEERFPMCSTFKFPLAAAVLARVDAGKESLDRTIAVPAHITLPVSPITSEHAGSTITVRDLCAAVLIRSDNTAANLLLDVLGGPAAVTDFLRSIGDKETRLDRNEPTLNESRPGDPRDTTTPQDMAQNLRKILLDKALKPASRAQIVEWMDSCVTGLERLRKNIPEGWHAADRTGSNGETTTNDIAILWPTNRPPVIVTAYITQCPGLEEKRGAMIAEIGRFVREAILLG